MSFKRYEGKYQFYRSVAIGLAKNVEVGEELVQELFLILLKKDKGLLERLDKEDKAEAYCIQIMKFQLYSKRSNFYKSELRWNKNRSENKVVDYLEEEQTELDFMHLVEMEKVELIIKRLPFFEREVFNVYFGGSGLSFTKFAEQSGISRKILYNTIEKVKAHIKEHYNDLEV